MTNQTTNQTQPAFKKVCRVGIKGPASIFVKVQWDGARLSITGVHGPRASGNAISCGQIVGDLGGFSSLAKGWTFGDVAKLRKVWDRWHLNDMRAGSPAQMEFLRANPVTDRRDYFSKASGALAAAGLNPDPNYLHNGKPYEYGSAWLRDEVPADVLEFLRGLPDADKQPAWV